jgi:hypothetical protein
MRKMLLTFSFFAFLAVAGDQVPPALPPSPGGNVAGRYQLLNGQISTPPNFKPSPIILRIDTATGKTWELMSIPVDKNGNSSVMGWVEVSEDVVNVAIDIQHKLQSKQTSPQPDKQ